MVLNEYKRFCEETGEQFKLAEDGMISFKHEGVELDFKIMKPDFDKLVDAVNNNVEEYTESVGKITTTTTVAALDLLDIAYFPSSVTPEVIIAIEKMKLEEDEFLIAVTILDTVNKSLITREFDLKNELLPIATMLGK